MASLLSKRLQKTKFSESSLQNKIKRERRQLGSCDESNEVETGGQSRLGTKKGTKRNGKELRRSEKDEELEKMRDGLRKWMEPYELAGL